MKRFQGQVCKFYNYDPKAKICELNNKVPQDSLASSKLQGDWETWTAVEPHYDNYNYHNKVKSFSKRFWDKIVFSRHAVYYWCTDTKFTILVFSI